MPIRMVDDPQDPNQGDSDDQGGGGGGRSNFQAAVAEVVCWVCCPCYSDCSGAKGSYFYW
jgi:hypothetical protein